MRSLPAVHPAFLLVLAGVLGTLIQRAFRRVVPLRLAPVVKRHACHVKVLLASKTDQPWQDCMWHLLTRASSPQNLRFRVLLRCRSLDDANVDLDSTFRQHARVSCVPRSRNDGSAENLVAHFLKGDEQWVCVVDVAARVGIGWDRAFVPSLPRMMLSCPLPKERGVASFPTLRRDGSRGRELSFAQPSHSLIPSVHWCAELSIASPSTWKGWVEGGEEPLHHVPAFPVLEEFTPVSNDSLPAKARTVSSSSHRERVGLTRHADDFEKISKYGSSRAARLAVDFAKEEEEGEGRG